MLYAKNRLPLSPGRASLAFMVCGLVMALLQVFAVGTLAKVVRPILQIAGGLALMGVGIAALVATRDYGLALVFVAVLALGTALVTPNLSALISSRGGHRVGTALGLKSAASSMGQRAGPLFGAVLLGWQQDSPLLLSGGLLLIISVVVGLRREGSGVSAQADDG